jgi:quinol-cytochrome oxidoreductase complex cytochrome b subunit
MTTNSEKKLFPYFLFEIVLVALFTVEIVLVLAVLFPSSPGREIDFSAAYQPRPEWYFLFLYQLTKYFPGKWTFVGAVLLPGLAFCLVLLAPFLDRGRATALRERKGTAAAGFGLLAIIAALTVLSLL